MFKERDNYFSEDEGPIINRDNLIKYTDFPSSATELFISSSSVSSAPDRRNNMKKKTSVSSLPSSSSGDDDPEGSSPFSINNNNNNSCCGSMGMNSSGEFGSNCDRKYSPSSSFSYTNLSPSRNNNNCNLDSSHQSHHHSISCSGGNVNNNNNNITCYGCDKAIYARYYIYAMDHHFHNECLKCHACHSVLSDQRTCFERDGKILCKQDYYSLYHNHNNPATKHPPRCARCTNLIDPKDLVMRACGLVYHVDCFVCTVCQRVLNRGDQFRMQSSDLYCSLHYEMIENFHTAPSSPFKSEIITPSSKPISNTSSPTSKRGRPPKRKLLSGVHENMKDVEGSLEYFHSQANNGKPPPSISALSGMGAEFNQIMDSPLNGYGIGPVSHHGNDLGVSLNLNGEMHGQQQKGKRMRTTFKHNQLRIMKSYFDMNPNPDTKDLKQLSTKTGLCKRVLQVWFQNARAKHRRSCPRSESSLSGSGVLQLDDSQSQDWSPPPQGFGQQQQAGVPIPSHPGGSLMQA